MHVLDVGGEEAQQLRQAGDRGREPPGQRREHRVEGRVGEQQRGRRPAVVVPHAERRPGGEVATGAVPTERDARGVDAQLGGVVPDPAERCHDVVVRDRVADAVDRQAGSRR